MEEAMRLYVHRLSPNGLKAIITAEHCGSPVELVDVDLGGGEQHGAAYRAINPNGRVPTLVDGSFVLWESNAIMQYLAEKAGERSIWPDDIRARADIARWQFWDVAHLGPAARPFQWEYLIKAMLGLGDPDEAAIAAAEAPFRACIDIVETTLGSQPYLAGERLTLADISIAATLIYAEAASMPLADYPALQSWRQKVGAIPAWSVARPQARVAA
jgi:glutathione S-transferase